MLDIIKKIIPKNIFTFFQPFYHYTLSVIGGVVYKFPSKNITVIGVTGTKGKSTTVELLNAVLENSGYKTSILNTIRFKVGDEEKRNMFKMTMPGRFFIQKFLRESVTAGCDFAIIEMTSEGAKQFRHKFIYLDALIFTNLAREHIESHGSYEKYIQAKLSIAKSLETTPKNNPVIIVNNDDKEAYKFLDLKIKNKLTYSLDSAIGIKSGEKGSSLQIGKVVIHSNLPGIFNVYNMLGVITYAKFLGIKDEDIKKSIESIDFIRGRMENIKKGQKFDVVVDYAHTPDSLKAVYETYKTDKPSIKNKLICVLGNTGGGRDRWKRKVMGQIADQYCEEVILTNEDPYDEDPRKIVEDMREAIKNKPVEIIMDRRKAIKEALSRANRLIKNKENSEIKVAVLITGKGTDPYIMEAGGKKTPWDDATVAREELNKILKK